MTKFLTPFLFLSIVSFGQSTIKQDIDTNSPEINGNWKTLDEKIYSIQYPSDWDLNQSGQMGMTFAVFSPLESSEDKFRENINLVIQDLTGKKIDLDKYTEISEGQIKSMITNSKITENKRFKKNTGDYQRIIYTGDQGVFQLKFEQHYWIIKEKAYVLTFTCEKNKFADFKEKGEKILTSFIIK